MKCEIATRCVAASAGQDRVWARVFDDLAIIAIADGAGGRAGGGEAAQIVVREAAQTAANIRDPRDARQWEDWLTEVGVLIGNDESTGETTAVVAAIGSDFVVGASVGDSSLWLIDGGSWRDLTENQSRKPPLGIGSARPKGFSAALNGQTTLFATDGLTKYADHDRIAQTARYVDLEVAATELIAAVRYASGNFPDDVSCVLCRVVTEASPAPKRKRFGLF